MTPEGHYNLSKMYIIKYWICFIYKFDNVGHPYPQRWPYLFVRLYNGPDYNYILITFLLLPHTFSYSLEGIFFFILLFFNRVLYRTVWCTKKNQCIAIHSLSIYCMIQNPGFRLCSKFYKQMIASRHSEVWGHFEFPSVDGKQVYLL